MDPETEKIIKEQMEKLPAEVRKIFVDPALGEKILNIGKKNGLNIEQLGIFQLETYLVMLGLVHPDEYPNELKSRLKIDDLKVDNIINDTNREILSGILEKLKEMYKKEEEDLDNMDEEKIKNNLANKNPDWKQNLDFVLSGGDYSVFLERRDDTINTTPRTPLVRGDTTSPSPDKG